MTTLDGNSIAGTLRSVFGTEMTGAAGTCAMCGAEGPVGELRVYPDAPGIVGRCPDCESILLVIVERRGFSCVDVSGFATLGRPAQL
jgi:uncharacterized protein DUF6510